MLKPDDYGMTDFLQILKSRYPEQVADWNRLNKVQDDLPHNFLEGTTVLALVYNDGVILAGDRQATEGYQVGERRIQKVFKIDRHSAIAVAGVAGPCFETAKLFQVQVEFYEKMEGTSLSLDGQANYLSSLVRMNLNLAMQGLIVLPIFAGYDIKQKKGRIFKYDALGGRYEEDTYYSIGSGGKDARSTLKKMYRPDMSEQDALTAVAEALWDAADEDIATGGPDLIRKIFPTLIAITEEGVSDVSNETVAGLFETLVSRLAQS